MKRDRFDVVNPVAPIDKLPRKVVRLVDKLNKELKYLFDLELRKTPEYSNPLGGLMFVHDYRRGNLASRLFYALIEKDKYQELFNILNGKSELEVAYEPLKEYMRYKMIQVIRRDANRNQLRRNNRLKKNRRNK